MILYLSTHTPVERLVIMMKSRLSGACVVVVTITLCMWVLVVGRDDVMMWVEPKEEEGTSVVTIAMDVEDALLLIVVSVADDKICMLVELAGVGRADDIIVSVANVCVAAVEVEAL